MTEKRFKELARRLANRSAELWGEPAAPALTIVQAGTGGLDSVTRDSHCKMIRHIRRRWGQPMQQLIDQACFGLAGVEQLSDDALVDLHRDLERAQECMRDGVTFEDAGLLRSRYG